jgi:hypothetical protein
MRQEIILLHAIASWVRNKAEMINTGDGITAGAFWE